MQMYSMFDWYYCWISWFSCPRDSYSLMYWSDITLLLGLRLSTRVAKCSIISKFSQLLRVSSARSVARILWLFNDFIVFPSTWFSKSPLNLFIEFMSKGGRFIKVSFSNHPFSNVTLFWISFSWWILLKTLTCVVPSHLWLRHHTYFHTCPEFQSQFHNL